LDTDLKYSERFSKLTEDVKACYSKPYEIKTDIQRHLEHLLLSIPDFSPSCIVDLCGGTGHVIHHLSSIYPDCHFINVDLNQKALDECKKLNNNLKLNTLLQNCYDTKLEASSADIVLCWLSFFHLSDPSNLAKEALRLLKHNGRIIISTLINKDHDFDIFANLVSDYGSINENKYLRNIYSKKTFEAFFAHNSPFPLDISYTNFKLTSKLEKPKGLGTYNVETSGQSIPPTSGGLLMPMEVVTIQIKK
tara:strand:+ start:33 stop:779 length:747 start_codon:yes stop_codon:yes gene_type:complete